MWLSCTCKRWIEAGLVATTVLWISACTERPRYSADIEAKTLFTLLPSSYTGVEFENRLTDTEEHNVFTYRNYYNGGGAAVADLNGDSLADLYFVSNQQANRLYLNRGDFHFDDVTKTSGAGGKHRWSTGVAMADVNGDGRIDIYVCNAGGYEGDDRANELFINTGNDEDGIPRFKEMAREYGVADKGFTTHASFFDYDRDGDLDLYVLNNSYRNISEVQQTNTRNVRDANGGDRLYRNEGARFTDVSEKAGILGSEIAFGMGVTVSDLNRDGWPDLYISNDFFERDYLYVNQRDGTFKEDLEQEMRLISLSSMGSDAADLNNDGYPELFVTDMLPEDDRRLKTTSSFESWDIYQGKVKIGFYHQFMRNMLHLNNADGTFTEIGQYAGTAATDWSWGALIADFNNDGNKDIFVANGIYQDVTDQDFIAYFARELNLLFRGKAKKLKFMELLKKIPSQPIANYMLASRGDLTFENKSREWGLDTPSFSNGSAYGDLDNDGDLDLIVNNVDQQAFVYRNETNRLTRNRSIRIRLEGENRNRNGIGAQVSVFYGGKLVYLEQTPARGFQSNVDMTLVTGLGAADRVDSLVVFWPDDRKQVVLNVTTGTTVVVHQKDARERVTQRVDRPDTSEPLLEPAENIPDYQHRENYFVDFNREPLVPKKISLEGPRMAVGDVNGDGLDDVYVGGAKESPGKLYIQQHGQFVSTNEDVFAIDAISEDIGSVLFDADNDDDRDLYVVSGGNEFSDMAPALQDRLYLNDGRGRFTKSIGHLPAEMVSGSCVTAADYDRDGDQDLFVGGRLVPWKYGIPPVSTILQNNGRGHFEDVTRQVAPELEHVGLVTDAVWTDFDQDRNLDLIVVGEWMPITLFRNTGRGTLEKVQSAGLDKSEGLWNRIAAADFDRDGDTDYVAGNLGQNTRIHASVDRPATLYAADFDRNGSVEQILTLFAGTRSYPYVLRDELLAQLPYLRQRFPNYADYAEKTVTDILTPEQLQAAETRSVYTLSSIYLENKGKEEFSVTPLPARVQYAPVYAILPGDFDGDGRMDLLLGGNFYGFRPGMGHADASYGWMLQGDGKGGFSYIDPAGSGVRVTGQIRDFGLVRVPGGPVVLVARNDDRLVGLRKSHSTAKPPKEKPASEGTLATRGR